MREFQITSELNALPNTAATLRNVYLLLSQNLKGYIIDDSLLSGQLGGDRPTVDKGPWMSNRSWQSWQEHVGYAPVDYMIGDEPNNVTLEASPTADRIQVIQDVDGTLATLDDAAGIRTGVRLTGNNVAVDWDASDNFSLILSYPMTLIQMENASNGAKVKLLILNQGTDNHITWDPSIVWPVASSPTAETAKAGETKGKYVIIRKINDVLYGENVGVYAVSNLGKPLSPSLH